jgi:proteasome assembly chaperone (PAC2) family protein
VKEIMSTKLVEEENTVYEVDEECLKEKTIEMEDAIAKIQEQECCECQMEEQQCCDDHSQRFPVILLLLLVCCCRN